MRADLAQAMPPDGFIANYVGWASEHVMAPPEFHLASILGAFSALLANRVVFPLGGENYPANLWLVLMASSGGKKSSAIRPALRLLDDATGGHYRLATEMTREALWARLADQPYGYIQLSEFMSFL